MKIRQWSAVGTVAFLAASQLVGAGGPAAAAVPEPHEVTSFPYEVPGPLLADRVLVTGTTGFLHQQEGREGYLWGDYATGRSATISALATVRPDTATFVPAGGDTIVYRVENTVTMLEPASGVSRTFKLSTEDTLLGLSSDSTRALVWLPFGRPELMAPVTDRYPTRVPMVGLPTGAVFAQNGTSVSPGGTGVVKYTVPIAGSTDRATGFSVITMATAQAVPVPGLGEDATTVGVAGENVYALRNTAPHAVSVLPLAAVLAGTATADQWRTLTLPAETGAVRSATVLGDRALLVLDGDSRSVVSAPLSAATPAGEPPAAVEPTTLVRALAADADAFLPGATSAMIVGGTASARNVLRVTSGGATPLIDLVHPASDRRTAALTSAYGMVRVFEAHTNVGAATAFMLTNHPLAPGSTNNNSGGFGSAGTEPTRLWSKLQPCAEDPHCIRVAGGYGGAALYARDGNAEGESVLTTVVDGHSSSQEVIVPARGVTLVDAAPGYVIANGGVPATQYLLTPGYENPIVRTGPVTGAALWFDTYWHTTGSGTVTATHARRGTDLRTVSTGSSCAPSELQVTQRWLYWSCGDTGPAGVLDLTSDARIAVDSGRALLGDGFLVRHDPVSGRLISTDFHSGTPAPAVSLGTALAGPTDDRHITWTVDRNNGQVAYAAADGKVHVAVTGVPGSAPTASIGAGQWASPDPSGFSIGFSASQPVASWQITINRASTGEQMAQFSGGPTPANASARWDCLVAGKPAFNGQYNWRVSVTIEGGAPASVGTGTVYLQKGRPEFRTYDDYYGKAALIGVQPNNEAHWYEAMDGKLVDQGYTERWYIGSGEVNLLVPFGDSNSDGANDLLVRSGAGVLSVVHGIGQAYFNTEGQTPRVIGGGWNIYPAILSMGDANKDGHDDILAKDAKGLLWFYAGAGKDGFQGRVQVDSGWNIYTRLVSPGDLNGDGNPDLLGVDSAGGLWRYFGNGRGGVNGPRVRVETGFNAYNAVIGIGDVNLDGHNDLVGRDGSGVLWKYLGTGEGTFRAREREGGGWNKFSYLF